MRPCIKPIFCLLFNLSLSIISTPQDTTEVVMAWLKQNSIPIKYLEAGNEFSDLDSLRKLLYDVQIVGMGETTHGTREIFTMKHRLVEFLVTQMGFTAFVLESSYSNCKPINDYILTGRGELAEVLTAQGYMAWDTEEFTSLLYWMRAFNEKAPEGRKLRFYGIDVYNFHDVGRKMVLNYIKKYAAEQIPLADSLFHVLACEENNWPTRMNQNVLQSAFTPLYELISFLNDSKAKLISVSSLEEWEQTRKYLEVIMRGLFVNVKDVPDGFESQQLMRDEYQAQNLFYIMEKEKPGTKFMIWQHNWHISKRAESRTLGHLLQERLGKKYYSIGFECYEGTFQARALMPNGFWGELKADTLLPMHKSLGWYFKQTGRTNFFIDLRNASSISVVEKWLGTPIRFNNGIWLFRGGKENFEIRQIKDLYDGIFFIERSTPARPTKAAIVRSKNRMGF